MTVGGGTNILETVGAASAAMPPGSPEILDGHALAARFIANARWETLPPAVQQRARLALIDNLGAALAGTLTRVYAIASGFAAATWPGSAATLLLRGKRAGTAGAAFANGAATNGIDIDDSTRYANGHGGAQIFPTALAVAEARGLSGAQLLCGLVVGYEVAHRAGRCWHASRDVYQACGSWGSVACAAVAAHLMGLPAEQAGHALGIADYQAPNLPMMRDIDHPAMVKHGIHWGAMTGVLSAELAAAGFTGIPSILSFPAFQEWTTDIGQNYLLVDGIAWKPKGFACCGWAHAAVEGAKTLVEKHGIRVAEIARVHIDTFAESARLGTRLPATTEEAQFNLAWPVAAMLIDGEIGPRQVLEDRLADPAIRALASRVDVAESPDLEELCRLYVAGDPRGRFASEVTITMAGGREYRSGLVEGPMRFPQGGWDDGKVEEKFRWLANNVLPVRVVDNLVDLLWHIEALPDLRELTILLA